MTKQGKVRIPAKGFYTHYKHTADGELHNYTYEVMGVTRNTDDNLLRVVYRPLYENDWFAPADYADRRLEEFMGTVEKDGVTMPRYTRITDQKMIRILKAVRVIMYGKPRE